VVVGIGNTHEGNEAFRWTPATGMVGLGHLPGGENESAALGVSDDGTVVVGWVEHLGREAMRWTAGTGMVGLGRLPGAQGSYASRASADGSVVVGISEFPATQVPVGEAFRWTEQDGMVGLGDLPGGLTFSEAHDVSADGSVVVGRGSTVGDDGEPEQTAFYWTAATGMLKLQDLLLSAGVTNLDGWLLGEARGVSADGLTIVGTGSHNDHVEAWLATIPEPSAWLLALLGMVGAGWFAIRRRF
jgi:probable HAF family extracellular repeat protein